MTPELIKLGRQQREFTMHWRRDARLVYSAKVETSSQTERWRREFGSTGGVDFLSRLVALINCICLWSLNWDADADAAYRRQSEDDVGLTKLFL